MRHPEQTGCLHGTGTDETREAPSRYLRRAGRAYVASARNSR